MKRKLPTEDFSIFDEVLDNTPIKDKLLVSRSLEIASQIILILEEKGLIQKDLANLCNKKEPEISKWLCGFHNFTLKSLVKIEACLGERIITTPKQAKEEIEQDLAKLYRKNYSRWINYVSTKGRMKKANLCFKKSENNESLKHYENPRLAKVIDMRRTMIETNDEDFKSTRNIV